MEKGIKYEKIMFNYFSFYRCTIGICSKWIQLGRNNKLQKIENDDGTINEEKLEEITDIEDNIDEEINEPEEKLNLVDEKCRDVLARTMADFDNFKKKIGRAPKLESRGRL